jgi:hypothetical protein
MLIQVPEKSEYCSFKKKKEKPLMERQFSELVSLADQLKWLELKKKQKDKEI